MKDNQDPPIEIVEESYADADEHDIDPAATLKKLKDKLKRCLEEKQMYLDLSQRFKADYSNLQKQTAVDREGTIKRANQNLLRDLLELADAFDYALGDEASLAAVPVGWRQGLDGLRAKLVAVFRQHGLEPFTPAVGDNFDPSSHEPVSSVDAESADQDNLIIAVVDKGYRLYDKIIRPAKVKVSVYKQ